MGRVRFRTLFLAGLAAGIFIMNLGKGVLLENTGLLDEYALYHMKYMTVDGGSLFCYVLCRRIGSALVLGILFTTYLGLFVCAAAAFWYGFSAGAFVAALALRYGPKGILLAFAGVFPQYLLYTPALAALILWGAQLNRGIYFHRQEEGLERSYFWTKKALRLAGILFALTMGCVLESFWNPQLVLALLQVF